MKKVYVLKLERNEYGKQIRKAYESHQIKERMCNIRDWGVRKDGYCSTITTVMKDYGYILEFNGNR